MVAWSCCFGVCGNAGHARGMSWIKRSPGSREKRGKALTTKILHPQQPRALPLVPPLHVSSAPQQLQTGKRAFDTWTFKLQQPSIRPFVSNAMYLIESLYHLVLDNKTVLNILAL